MILITVDTLRADRLGVYGSTTTETPHVDQLAAEGLVFDRAVAPMPETRPSHYTLMTSLYPGDHGVLSNAAAAVPGLVTLPAVFRQAGYATAGVAGCELFDAAAGEALGFEWFDAPDKLQRAADQGVPAALRWLETHPPEKPFFLWLHLFDPHMPYVPLPFEATSAPESVYERPGFSWPELYRIAAKNDGDLPRHELDRARGLYDGEVEYVDHWLGRFFAALRQAGLWDDALIVFTADHGECFENGVFFDHSQCLGEGALAVPLIVRYPRRVAPGRSEKPVEHLDVAPALLRLAGLEVPASFQGRGLLERPADDAEVFFQHPLYRRRDVAARREVLSKLRSVAGEPTRTVFGDRLQLGVRRWPWKLLQRGDTAQLFHLEDDPAERRDVAADHPEIVRELQQEAWRFMKKHPLRLDNRDELDPALVERLEALGYL